MSFYEFVIPHSSKEEHRVFVSYLLPRALRDAKVGDSRLSAIMSDPELALSPRQLVNSAAPFDAPFPRVAENIILLANAPTRMRQEVATVIDDLSERLIQRGRDNLGQVAYQAWAALIEEASGDTAHVQLRAAIPTLAAAIPTLAYALARRETPVSALIVATFPVTYGELLRSTGDEDFNRLPALFKLPFSFFTDWDRAKAARHELVDAYLYSMWPPADLLLVSMRCGIQENTLRRLVRSHRGVEYLAAIGRDSRRLSPKDFSDIQGCLSRYSRY